MIALIEFDNCGPFKGKHEIRLGPGAHAIVAQHENDKTKSNGCGKSFILEMVTFAITGWLSPSREGTVDRWITDGEARGDVTLTFEDGAKIHRWKQRRQSAQVRFTRPDHGEAAQDAAEKAILEYLSITAADFHNVAFFEQRKMAKLVDPDQTKPNERLEIVSGWFGLGLAERAEERAGEWAAMHEKALSQLTAQRDVLAARWTTPAPEHWVETMRAALDQKLARTKALEAVGREARRVDGARQIVAAQDERIKEALTLRARIDEAGDPSDEVDKGRAEIAKLAAQVERLTAEAKKRKTVSLGLFDGACPVATLECPVKDKINKDRTSSSRAYKEARAAADAAEERLTEAEDRHRPLFQRARALEIMRGNLEQLRAMVRSNAPDVKVAKEQLLAAPTLDDDHEDQLETAKQEERAAAVAHATARNEMTQRAADAAQLEVLNAQIAARHRLVSQHLKLRAIYRLAQRNVAERNLSFVEDEANALLAEADIDLTVKARWEREAGGPAKTCEDCGAAFPASAKVKACERCGTPRGTHTVQRLDFVLSDRSGALNDLGGVVLQLAAGAWLLGARHSPWSTCLLDEPFAQCDAFNRRALATQLVKLITRGVFRQSLIISHSAETIDMYPHKIVITRHADGRRSIATS